MGDRVHLSLKDDAQATMEELEDEIENIYGSKSAFFRQKLMEYDRKSTLKAKKEMLDNRIEGLEDRIEELELMRKGVEEKLDEATIEEEETDNSIEFDDEEFWDKTISLIAKKKSRDDPDKFSHRFDKYFEARFNLYRNRYDEDIGLQDFRDRFIGVLKSKGFEDEADEVMS